MTAQSVSSEEIRYYDVEIIIFESKESYDRQSEEWPSDIQREMPPTQIELGQPYPGPLPAGFDPKLTFKLLPRNAYRLQQEVKLLEASDRYTLLYHTAWRQPGMDATTALPVHIKQTYVQQMSQPMFNDPDRPPSGLPTPAHVQQTRNELNGYIRLILSRYLHAEVDLIYTTGLQDGNVAIDTANPEAAVQAIPPVMYRLQESRRMRSTEVHYLDHPVIGMIILVTPYEGK